MNNWASKKMPSSKVIIFGCGGHGRVVHDILMNIGNVDIVGFVREGDLLFVVRFILV